ncbi:DUF4825 domain-containing protein [Peribacillus phoenicis]|uniref:DUF4825 domain-containing protein n=1 Tax=unclassified Peribacillus TaxID=2675266 RepID=UPI0039A20656
MDAKKVDKEMKETVISNSTFLFALIKNVDWITFKFPDREFSVTKEKLQDWYNNKLDGFENEQDLKKLIQEHLKSEDSVNSFFTSKSKSALDKSTLIFRVLSTTIFNRA